MHTFHKYLFVGLILCGNVFLAATSRAEWPGTVPTAPTVAGDVQLGRALSDEYLGDLNGRQDTQIDQLSMSVTEVNSSSQMDSNFINATGSTFNNGANSIGQGAFSNASGMVTVIQNSGNQVLIHNDMVLNLFMK